MFVTVLARRSPVGVGSEIVNSVGDGVGGGEVDVSDGAGDGGCRRGVTVRRVGVHVGVFGGVTMPPILVMVWLSARRNCTLCRCVSVTVLVCSEA